MYRRKQFSDKITLFLAEQTHAVEFVMRLLALGGKSVLYADYHVELFTSCFKLSRRQKLQSCLGDK